MLSEHSVFEGHSQKHVHGGREEGTEDGGQRKGGMDGGTEDLLVYGTSGTERGVGFKRGLVYIFTRGPQQFPDWGFPILLLFSGRNFKS